MATELSFGPFLSLLSSFENVFDWLSCQEVVEFVREMELESEFKKLQMILSSVRGLVYDAETKQMRDEGVKQWLQRVNNAVNDAEELILQIHEDAVRFGQFEVAVGGFGSSTSSPLFPTNRGSVIAGKIKGATETMIERLLNFVQLRGEKRQEHQQEKQKQQEIQANKQPIHSSRDRSGWYRLTQSILGSLEDIVREKDQHGLREGVEVETTTTSSETTTKMEVEEEEESYHIYGRDADREAIFKSLLSDEDEEEEEGGDKICIIPIAGISGIGKTTLAQLVYTDIDNRKRFDVKTWITVSNEYDDDVFTLSKVIYERVTGSKNCRINDTVQILPKLKEFLQGKKILIVLDNVGNLNSQSWHALKSSFESAASGSKIVVTTNNEHIGSMLGTVPTHWLQLLSEKDCWQLFSNHAFNNVEASAYLNLEGIGRQIVKKCRGLPLAIKSIAGLLRTEVNTTTWNNVLKNEAWNLPGGNVHVALWLSYRYLPPHLKWCFAYCSIFPKGYEFRKEKLILLWMADGLLLPQNGKMLEEVGEEYFADLTSRSFFCKSKFYGFTMHDLAHDLAQLVSREYCSGLEDYKSKISRVKIRHLSWTGNERHNIRKLVYVSKTNALRTLLRVDGWSGLNNKFFIHPQGLQNFQYLRVLSLYQVDAVTELLDSIGKLKRLRYLDLSWTEINEIPNTICSLDNLQTLLLQHCCNLSHLPDSIGNMKHLRHLDLSNTQVEEIPDKLCNLHNLHTLLLGSCKKLTRLPDGIERLINLHHLDISDTSLREVPPQVSTLRSLEIISDFVVGTNSGSSIEALGELQDMCDNLSIRSLQKVRNVDDVSPDDLEDKKCITDLCLEWEGDTIDSQKALEVLNRLQTLMDLEQLSIINYGGISFLGWVGEHSFSRLVYMWLSKCRNCCNLPPLGQLPSLKSLSIDGFDMVESIGNEFYISGSSTLSKPFKSLEKLSFKFMPRLKEWSCQEGEVFSQLKQLHLVDCPSLTLDAACFPDSLPSLKYLCISKCQLQVMASLLSCQLPLLSSLYIGYCSELGSFPERRLPTNIHAVEIFGCENLKLFLEERWPANLKSLSIGSCGKLFAPHVQWNLQALTSLTSLDFNCIYEELNSFPEGGQLPTNLTSLTLCRLHNLKSLNGKAFQQLTSLEKLSISYCQQLHCMPEEGLPATLSSLHLSCLDNLESLSDKAFGQLASLEKLSISYCPQLLCLPEEGLPASLSQLTIKCCRFLNPRCQRETGEDWPLIAHIPRISIIQY